MDVAMDVNLWIDGKFQSPELCEMCEPEWEGSERIQRRLEIHSCFPYKTTLDMPLVLGKKILPA